MLSKNRVVITGLGILGACGIGIEKFWDSLIRGKSGIGPVTLFDASSLKSRIAGEVKGFDPEKHLGFRVKPNRVARHTQFALSATKMAIEDAHLDIKNYFQKTIPIVMGNSTSAFDIIQYGNDLIFDRGLSYNTPYIVSSSSPHSVASAISEFLDVKTQTITISTACASGLDAIGYAAEMIRSGRSSIAITGGSDAPIVPSFFSSFDVAGLSSTQNEEPEKASRPFDLKRDSGVIAEGAGMLILENLDHALARGANPYVEITGYATQMDSDVKVPASGFSHTMTLAIANAGKRTEAVDYLCAHGPSHPILDRVETEMIKKVFGEYAYNIPVSSIKGAVGNPLSAAGPMQIIASALAVRKGLIPPTANYEFPDPACDLDYVPEARMAQVSCALVNVHGVGGINSSLVVERVQ
jgi:3-oxoacyl-[acyl-carrier-protein] synthase II